MRPRKTAETPVFDEPIPTIPDTKPRPTLVVCLKPVWRSDVPLRLHEDRRDLVHGDAITGPNPADLAALQCARTVKLDILGGTAQILALTFGPRSADEVLRTALACGADEVRRVWLPEDGAEHLPWLQMTRVHARLLGEVIRQVDPFLVISGDRSSDHGSESFGATLAALLRADFARRVVAINQMVPEEQTNEAGRTGETLQVQVRVERGYRQTLHLQTPAVITVAAQGAAPPEPDLPAWIASRRADIPLTRVVASPAHGAEVELRRPLPRVKKRSDLPRQDSAEGRIADMMALTGGAEGTILKEGDPATQAEAVLELLNSRGYLDRS